jgi:RNA chaperone Hfq
MEQFPPLEYNELNAADQPLATEFISDNLYQPVCVFLTSGVRLEGSIVKQDKESLILSRNDNSQMVYKHAIATILPSNG